MAIIIKRLDGGTVCPSVTWRQLQRSGNGVVKTNTFVGSGPTYAVDKELRKLRGVTTNFGIYKEHKLTQGAPNIYDVVEVTFQFLEDPPVYLYDFSSSLASAPLSKHPGYRTYWDHDLVTISGSGASSQFTTAKMDSYQLVADNTIAAADRASYKWRKAGQAVPKGEEIVVWDGAGAKPSSLKETMKACKTGFTSYKVPSITVRETVYFVEWGDYAFTPSTLDLTKPNVNSKTIASMSGCAGWPLMTQFGFPRDVYSLLNITIQYDLKGEAYEIDYSNYRKVAKQVSFSGVTTTVSNVNLTEAHFKKIGIPVTQYIPASVTGSFGKNAYGHPMWLCTNVKIKKVGYWFEATLEWEYYALGVDAELYPLAEARVNGWA